MERIYGKKQEYIKQETPFKIVVGEVKRVLMHLAIA